MYTAPTSRLNSLQWQVLSTMSLCWATSQNVITSQWAPGESSLGSQAPQRGTSWGGGQGCGNQGLKPFSCFWLQPRGQVKTQKRFKGHRKPTLSTFFFFFGHPAAYGVPHIRSGPWLWPTRQLCQRWILNPLCRAGDQICILALQRCHRPHCTTVGTPTLSTFAPTLTSLISSS